MKSIINFNKTGRSGASYDYRFLFVDNIGLGYKKRALNTSMSSINTNFKLIYEDFSCKQR